MRFVPYFLLPLALSGILNIAHADEYGCKVMMCMSNPQGPMAEPQCRETIQKFIRGQSKKPKDPHPTCEEAQNTQMQIAMRPYDQCPSGTSALGLDSEALMLQPALYVQLLQQIRPVPGRVWERAVLEMPAGSTTIYTGIGEGDQSAGGRNKVCVGNMLGPISFKAGTDEEPSVRTVSVYDQVTTIAPATAPRVMDIYVDQKLYRSTRF